MAQYLLYGGYCECFINVNLQYTKLYYVVIGLHWCNIFIKNSICTEAGTQDIGLSIFIFNKNNNKAVYLVKTIF